MACAPQNPELPNGFQGEAFIGKIWDETYMVCDFLLIDCCEVTGQRSRTLVLSL